MPIYEYQCQSCAHRFSKYFRTMHGANDGVPVTCPACQSDDTRRTVSLFGVGGGATSGASEPDASASAAARSAKITPKSQIDRWRQGKR